MRGLWGLDCYFACDITATNTQRSIPTKDHNTSHFDSTLIMPRTFITPKGKNLSFVRNLGSGQFGVADLVRDRKHENYCMKQVPVRTSDEDAKAEVLREVEMMQVSKHPNIVCLFDSWFDRNRLYILMEFCMNSSLDVLISEYGKKMIRFTEDKIVSFLTEISSALTFLHDTLRIMHRDLKPANIFMDKIGTLKIGDFGLSKCLGGEDLCATFVGTPLYMSPEQCRGESYSFKTDVWALGCIAYELMAFKSPWMFGDCQSYPALVQNIITGKPRFEILSQCYSDNLLNSTRWMLCKEPTMRWTAAKVNSTLRPQNIMAPFDASIALPATVTRACPSPVNDANYYQNYHALTTYVDPVPFVPSALPSPSVEPSQTIQRQRRLVNEAAQFAAECIQRSYRRKYEDHVAKDEKPLTPMNKVGAQHVVRAVPRPSVPEVTPRPAAKATGDTTAAVETIQTIFRASLNRRRKAPTTRYAERQNIRRNAPTPPSPQQQPQCSTRITQLAVPRARMTGAKAPTPMPKRIPPLPRLNARPTPRQAWL